jgi:hypothetical protein
VFTHRCNKSNLSLETRNFICLYVIKIFGGKKLTLDMEHIEDLTASVMFCDYQLHLAVQIYWNLYHMAITKLLIQIKKKFIRPLQYVSLL